MAVSLRTALAVLGADGAAGGSVRGLLAAHGFAPPMRLRELPGTLAPVRIRHRITPSSLDGWCELAAWPDGRVEYSGHVHDSGLLDIRYSVVTSVPVPPPPGPILLGRQGFVGGTLGLDGRDDDWHQRGHSDWVRANWPAFVAATTQARTDAGAGIGLTELLTTFIGGGTGLWVFGLP
ncbi:hypothetical protein ACFQY4_34720 [Catellatospora bangladeshensis]|uniref:Uncharacterized protein n=1 Tax=Catellatospora bangladeshensis TaxID=310355 RepID=A0A8J3NN22_9ACTN|nr:hypothetical protein [Catellatospora bangladeshensis]GIF85841.1 hypothetical protein Cba03nite_71900 [Catellatospora bangladeshensis]